MKPNNEEIKLTDWLRSQFDFPIKISYIIYNYGNRNCTVLIDAINEEPPRVHTSTNEYDMGPQSTILHKYARTVIKDLNLQWYSSLIGFMIPIESLKKLYDIKVNLN